MTKGTTGGRRILRLAARTLLTLIVVALLAAGGGGLWLHGQLQDSLALLDGEVTIPGLGAPVTVERDALGVPTIRGRSRVDLARALGFLHAQERFFQMDLSRRRAAGELAELFGALALEADREVRIHRFRTLARRVFDSLDASDRERLVAYAAGVEAGLAELAAPPFEYLLLGTEPAPWKPEDSVLVIYAMYLLLQDPGGRHEAAFGLMHDVLPQALYEFLTPPGTEWDAPVVGEPLIGPPIPGPEVVDLRAPLPESASTGTAGPGSWGITPRSTDPLATRAQAGSNNWAVAGSHTAHGGALLANDMHLGLSVPNTWYRASLVYPDGDGGERRITGVTLPGLDGVVVGSNGRVAWGFTNSYGDWSDLVVVEPAPGDPDSYLTPDGPRPIERFTETIRVKGEEDDPLEVEWTRWGPIVDADHQGRRRALRWVVHDPEGIDLDLLRLEHVTTVDEALTVAAGLGIPAQNFVVADAGGQIGWTIGGPIPRRFGFDGQLPASWADGTRGWDGWLPAAEYPRLVDPEPGRIWTANARVVSDDLLARIGDGGYDLGARAGQIRDDLLALERAHEAALLAVQLDDRARFLERWHELLLAVLTPEAVAHDARRRQLRELVVEWGGRAAVESAGYRLVRAYRLILSDRVLAALTAPCKEADERFHHRALNQAEGPLWRLVTERPPHLLDPEYESWDELLLAAVDLTIAAVAGQDSDLARYPWGERNTLASRHPLSQAVPLVGRWLDMPADPLPGDDDMPRVQSPSFGASQRLVVSPGREEEGIFHMPGGQSGHPLSPFYCNSHPAWAGGEATPFLPGPTIHTLRLVPAAEAGPGSGPTR